MIRRTVDVVVALLVLVLTSPLLLVTGLLVVAGSRGGPLYFSPRAGQDGHVFRLWKFRSMRPAVASDAPPVTGSGDARVTPLGRVLRRTKIDELPGFVNLLRGDVTLVGPRPEAPALVERYTPAQREVLRVRPGITGPNQLRLSDEESEIPSDADPVEFYVAHLMTDKIAVDLAYLRDRTPWSDTRLVLRTAALVLARLVEVVRRRG